MKIVVVIDSCWDCRHRGFSVLGGNVKYVCQHPEIFTVLEDLYPGYDQTNRVVEDSKGKLKGISEFCPLKFGHRY